MLAQGQWMVVGYNLLLLGLQAVLILLFAVIAYYIKRRAVLAIDIFKFIAP